MGRFEHWELGIEEEQHNMPIEYLVVKSSQACIHLKHPVQVGFLSQKGRHVLGGMMI